MRLPLARVALLAALIPAACRSGTTAPGPVQPVPSARQLRWHELQYYAFVHFNMNTFTDVEWGEGSEDPDTFAPTALDCRQWARVARAAGMRGIIITAKHHDGFCLWPSDYTEHSVDLAVEMTLGSRLSVGQHRWKRCKHHRDICAGKTARRAFRADSL